MFDCIAGYHLNPWTCGIAKFNTILGERIGVPVVSVLGLEHTKYDRPLLSVKLSEFSDPDIRSLDSWVRDHAGKFELFLHDSDRTEAERRLLQAADSVYCGNHELVARLSDTRRDIRELWCPGTILNAKRFESSELSVFTFGMAHKIRVPYYRRLRKLLDGTRRTYAIYVSTAVHENTSFDGSFVVTFEELQAVFEDRVYFLGYLSDTAVFNHLLDSSFLAAFFERGVRANNTTVNAAMECGCPVLTNMDEHSPSGFAHMKNVIDIERCDRLPEPSELENIGKAGALTAREQYGWECLVEQFQKQASVVDA